MHPNESNESLALRNGWWVGLLLINISYGGYLFLQPMVAAIPGAAVFVLVNAYTVFTIKSNRGRRVRYRHVSSESQVCANWLWTAGAVAAGVPALSVSEQLPGVGSIVPALFFVGTHRFFIRLALAGEDEDLPLDERDRKIAGMPLASCTGRLRSPFWRPRLCCGWGRTSPNFCSGHKPGFSAVSSPVAWFR
jgi:hypothetical protein